MKRKSAALVLAILIAITGFGSVNIYADDGSENPSGADAVVLTEDMTTEDEAAAAAEDTAAEDEAVTEEPAAAEEDAAAEETEEPAEEVAEEPAEAAVAGEAAEPEAPAEEQVTKAAPEEKVADTAATPEEESEEQETPDGWNDDMYYTAKASNGTNYTAADGPVEIDGVKYYFNKKGHLWSTSGVATFDGKKYYVKDTGVVAAGGWVYKNGTRTYYARSSGALYADIKVKVDGYPRVFDKHGKFQRGPKIVSAGGSKYYVNKNGVVKTKAGTVKVNGKKYFVNKGGKVRTKSGLVTFKTSKGKTVRYFIKKNGTVRTTPGIVTVKAGGATHRFYVKKGGQIRLKKGFVTYNDHKYYVRNNGKGWLLTDTMKKINGSKYIFSSTGRVRKGIVKYEGDYYYCYAGTGKVRTEIGMIQTQDKKASVYVSSKSGKLLTKEKITIDGAKYIFKANARRAKGIVKLDGKYYYCSPKNDGQIRTQEGKFKYGGKLYYAKENGELYRDQFIVNDEIVYHASKKAYLNTKAFTAKATSGDDVLLHPNAKTGRIPFSEYAQLTPYPAAPSSTEPCVLVDIGDQTLYYYENGKLKFKTPVVTGRIYGQKYHGTPTGTFYVQSKQTNTYLEGLEDDGKTKYKSFVNYWMPFTGNGYGLHDATWRGSFGGTIYQYSGSHGCVNMPLSYAERLFAGIRVGSIVKIQH